MKNKFLILSLPIAIWIFSSCSSEEKDSPPSRPHYQQEILTKNNEKSSFQMRAPKRKVRIFRNTLTNWWCWNVTWYDDDGDIIAERYGSLPTKKLAKEETKKWQDCPGPEYPFNPDKRP